VQRPWGPRSGRTVVNGTAQRPQSVTACIQGEQGVPVTATLRPFREPWEAPEVATPPAMVAGRPGCRERGPLRVVSAHTTAGTRASCAAGADRRRAVYPYEPFYSGIPGQSLPAARVYHR